METLEKVWLLEIDALDDLDNPVVLRFSSGDYTSPPPDNQYYENRLKQPALFTNSAFGNAIIQSSGTAGFGEATLVNNDGALEYLVDYAIDGREMRVKLREADGTINTVIVGTVQSISFEENQVSIRLRSPSEEFDLEHPHEKYLGNNVLPDGVEGTEDDIKGTRKPEVYGSVMNASPVLVNTAKLVYEFHRYDTEADLIAVYDRGILLTHEDVYVSLAALLAATIPASHYGIFAGYLRLGSQPDGEITADVVSEDELLGDVFEHVVTEVGKTVNAADIAPLNAVGRVGIYLRDDFKTTAEILDILAASCGGYWWVDKAGDVRMKQLVAPSSPTVFLKDYHTVRIDRKSIASGSNNLPVWEVSLKADKVETVQRDLAAAVPADRKARLAEQFREGVYSDSAVKTRHPLSEEIEYETALRDLADADFQAQRIQELLGVRRDSVLLEVRLDDDPDVIDAIEIGTVVNLENYKFYPSGKDFIVLGYTVDAKRYRVTLELWG